MCRALVSVQTRAVGEKATPGKKSNTARNKGLKKMKGEKKQKVRYLQKGTIRYFLPMLTTLSYVCSLMLGRR